MNPNMGVFRKPRIYLYLSRYARKIKGFRLFIVVYYSCIMEYITLQNKLNFTRIAHELHTEIQSRLHSMQYP